MSSGFVIAPGLAGSPSWRNARAGGIVAAGRLKPAERSAAGPRARRERRGERTGTKGEGKGEGKRRPAGGLLLFAAGEVLDLGALFAGVGGRALGGGGVRRGGPGDGGLGGTGGGRGRASR